MVLFWNTANIYHLLAVVLIQTAVLSSPPEQAIVYCTNKGGDVQLQWRLPSPSTTSTVVIINPREEEVLACVEGEVRVAQAYQARVQEVKAKDRQIEVKLKKVSSSDAGKYVCREQSAQGPIVPDCSQLLCYVDIERPSISIGNYPVLGQLLILTCLARLPYPWLDLGLRFSFEWLKDDVIIEGERGRELIRQKLAREDKGSYACRVTEDTQSCATSAESKPVHVHVMMGPSLHIRPENGTKNSTGPAEAPQNIILSAGESLILVCEVLSASPPVPVDGYNWTLITSSPQSLHQFKENGPTLRLSNLTRDQDGVYTCQARNDEGFEGYIPTGQASIRVSIRYLENMRLLVRPGKEVQEGEQLTITCTVDSNPPPKLQWIVNGVDKRYIRGNVDNYIVPKTSMEDSGNYTCLATIGEQFQLQQSTTVAIKKPVGPPILYTSSQSGPAHFSWSLFFVDTSLLVVVTSPGEEEVLIFNGNSRYDISSLYKDRIISVSLTNESIQFFLTDVTRNDAGNYTCRQGDHKLGPLIPKCGQILYYLDENSVTLMSSASISKQIRQGQNLTLTCVVEVTSLPLPTFSWTFQPSASTPRPPPQQLQETGVTLTLGPLTREDSGLYSCQANSVAGQSSVILTVIEIKESEKPSAAFIAGISVSVIVVVVVVAAIVGLCYWRRRTNSATMFGAETAHENPEREAVLSSKANPDIATTPSAGVAEETVELVATTPRRNSGETEIKQRKPSGST